MTKLQQTLSANKGIKAKRKVLSEVSKQIRSSGEFNTVNEGLTKIYGVENIELKTFNGWRRENKQVKKGSDSYVFWSKPIRVVDKVQEDEFEFFNLCFLFSEDQVE